MQNPVSAELDKIWNRLRIIDRRRLSALRKRFTALQESGNNPEELAAVSGKLKQAMEKAAEKSLVPYAERIRCELPEELPITAKIPQIRAAMKEHQVVIVCGATGSGKTTQLPKAALLEGFGRKGRIGCTQPRRIAASALASRLAAETDCSCGQEIGYQVRFDDQTSDRTVIKFMTDGILLAETRNDPNLYQYDCLILDEVHERSLNIDFLLGYVKLLLKRRKDIRILISSATLESARLSEYFGNAPVIEAEGRTYPVEDCWLPPEEEEELPESVARGVEFLGEMDSSGDILVFLPGEREIRDCAEMLEGRRYPRTEVLPLFGRLSAGEQARIFQRSSRRRIILATNVAETSLTIPGIRFVIDSGLVRLSRYNPRSRIQELRIETVSKASAKQRRGRCGRLQDGICVHLCSEEDYEKSDDYTDPEIQRSSLAGVILQMEVLRLPHIGEFPFVDPPSPALIREGMTALTDLGALDKNGSITAKGRTLAEFPLDPHLAAVLLAGEKYRVLPEIAVIAAFLSIVDPRERPFEKAKEADAAHKKFLSDTSDFLSVLHLWCAVRDEAGVSNSALRKFTKSNFLNFRRVREWRNLVSDLMDSAEKEMTEFDSAKTAFDPLHKALMSGLPRHLAMQTENGEYSDMHGKKFLIFPGSGLAKRKNAPRWLMFFSLVETSRIFGRTVAEIKPEWLEETAPALCSKIYDRVEWDPVNGFVYARERVTAGALMIHPGRRCHYGRIDSAKSRDVFIREGLVPGRICIAGTWAAEYVKKVKVLRELEIRQRRPDSIVNEPALYRHFENVIPPGMCSLRDVKQDWARTRKDYSPEEETFLLCDKSELHPEDFPDEIESAGFKVKVRYVCDPGEKDDGLTYHIPESCLNLVDRHLADYPVAGYLPWKTDHALRSLPKAYRKEIMPLSNAAELFMADFKAGKIFTGQSFHRALLDFLNENYQLEIPESTLEQTGYPAYMKVKIAVTGNDGKVLRTIHEIPRNNTEGGTVSRNLSAAKKLTLSGAVNWPEGLSLPVSVRISPRHDKVAYPALADEGKSVGSELFLDPEEAKRSHRKGLVRLVKLRLPSLMKQCYNLLKATPRMKLSLLYQSPGWADDVMSYSILSSFRDAPEKIRSAQTFENNLDPVRDHAADNVKNNFDFLNYTASLIADIEELLAHFREDSLIRQDILAQLNYLFRDGFFRTPSAVGEYPRYLKALKIRMERAKTSPGKDAVKGEFLQEYLRKYRTAVNGGKTPETSSAMLDFFLLLEEARISAWSPEQPLKRKVSAAILQNAWEEWKKKF